jgi:aconitase B
MIDFVPPLDAGKSMQITDVLLGLHAANPTRSADDLVNLVVAELAPGYTSAANVRRLLLIQRLAGAIQLQQDKINFERVARWL